VKTVRENVLFIKIELLLIPKYQGLKFTSTKFFIYYFMKFYLFKSLNPYILDARVVDLKMNFLDIQILSIYYILDAADVENGPIALRLFVALLDLMHDLFMIKQIMFGLRLVHKYKIATKILTKNNVVLNFRSGRLQRIGGYMQMFVKI
jgi:hypothetical protein